MVDGFFSDVTEPIRFGGLDSDDPLAFKVYEADRLVLGKRMEDHLRPGICFWHSFAWAGIGHVRRGTLDRPWLTGPAIRWTPRGRRWPSPSSSSRSWASRSTASTTATSSPEGATLRRIPLEPGCARRRRGRLPGADRRSAAVGHGQSLHPPRYQAGAATNPDPEVFAYAAAQVKHMLEITKRLGGENYVLWGGREGYDTLLEHRPCARGRPVRPLPAPCRRAQAPDRLHGSAPDRTEADGADQAPVRLRHGDGATASSSATASRASTPSTSRRTTRRSPATASITRSRTRSRTGSSAASTRTAATPRTAGTRTSSRTRSRTSRCRCTRSSEHGGIATGGFNFDAKLRRQSIDRTDLFHAHIGGIDTLARALLVAADMIERGTLAELREARYAGLGRSARPGDPRRNASRSSRSRQGRRRRDRSDARVRSAGAAGERRQPVSLVADGPGDRRRRPLTG